MRWCITDIGPWARFVDRECRHSGAGRNDSAAGEFSGLFRARSAASLDHCGGNASPPPWATTWGLRSATTADDRCWRATRLLFRIQDTTLARGEGLFARYGAVTIFFARFVFGMRIIAGPLAGVLRMPWRKFMVFNFLGAGLWVTVISGAGYLFGRHWDRLERDVRTVRRRDRDCRAVGGGVTVVAQPAPALSGASAE